MPIAASGAVSFSDLRSEFSSGSGAVSFSDLYRGGSNILAKAANNTGVNLAASVPASGTINFTNFRGTAKGFRYIYTAGATNQNASAIFGDDYAANYPKEIVIDSGVELGATSTSEEALQINSGGAGTITITNNGTLSGAGGAANSGAGGDAFEANVACILINNGTIRAGGGGGGRGGNGNFGTVQKQYQNSYWYKYVRLCTTANHGELWWGTNNLVFSIRGCGCNCSRNTGGWTYKKSDRVGCGCGDHEAMRQRTNYTSTSGGNGGRGQGYNHGSAGGSNGGTNAGRGGNGGGYGSSGANGAGGNVSGGAGAGAAGKYIRGLGNVTFTNNGTVQGGTA